MGDSTAMSSSLGSTLILSGQFEQICSLKNRDMKGQIMAKEKIENMNANQLNKRKKIAFFILGILVGVSLFNVIIAIITEKFYLIAVSAGALVSGFPMLIGMKKINEELERRGHN